MSLVLLYQQNLSGASIQPPVMQSSPQGATGSISKEWSIHIPRIPEKQAYPFKRNMENQDRRDIQDLIGILQELDF